MAAKRSVNERAPLGRALIASTAAEIIDEVGVENLTMRAMAARLGVSAMALYHHVEDKDELLRMVGDDLLGQIKLPDPNSGDWRELFTAMVTAAMDALRSVPGLSSVLLTSKLLPNARNIILFCIHHFERAGLDRDAAWEAYATVHQLVLGRLLVEESPNFRLSPTPHADDEIRDYVAKLRSPASFESAGGVVGPLPTASSPTSIGGTIHVKLLWSLSDWEGGTMYGLPPELVVTADGPTRIVTLNRPEARNGVNRSMHQALARVWDHLAADHDARVVVMTGRGPNFSAGGDFDYMQENIDDAGLRAQTIDEGRAIVTGMVRCPLPVIAAVNGPAVGLGCSLALLSDLVLMADTSFLADPHLRMGLVPGDGGMVWPALTGLSRAKEYLFLGERISAPQAVELGLASRVLAADELMTEAISLATRLAKMPAAALRHTKRALNAYLEAQLPNAFELAFTGELESMHSPEHRDAVAAARAKSAGRSQ